MAGGDQPGPGTYKDAKLSPRVARSESSQLVVLAAPLSSIAGGCFQSRLSTGLVLTYVFAVLQRLRVVLSVVRKRIGKNLMAGHENGITWREVNQCSNAVRSLLQSSWASCLAWTHPDDQMHADTCNVRA
jgi:hypothetical protein|eukprot:COSAG02_NODE_16110_length_1112_cov_1.568608_1_plen_130_part_00